MAGPAGRGCRSAAQPVRAEVTAEVMAEPVNRARQFLRRGVDDEGNPIEGAGKLDLEALRKMYGDGEAAMWRRLRVGGKLIDAKGVSRLYRTRISSWSLVGLGLVCLLALFVALWSTPTGQATLQLLGARWDDLWAFAEGLLT